MKNILNHFKNAQESLHTRFIAPPPRKCKRSKGFGLTCKFNAIFSGLPRRRFATPRNDNNHLNLPVIANEVKQSRKTGKNHKCKCHAARPANGGNGISASHQFSGQIKRIFTYIMRCRIEFGMTVNFNKQAAFTLAEILITLAIIGIIAALTIPNLLQKYQEHVTVQKVKQTYAILANAYKIALNENGPIEDWGLTLKSTPQQSNLIMQKFVPYMNIAKNCELKGGCWTQDGPYQDLKGNTYYQLGARGDSTVLLKNGVALLFYKIEQSDTVPQPFLVDIKVFPNKKDIFGKNLFQFWFTNNTVLFSWKKDIDEEYLINNCNRKTGKTGSCTAWIIYKGNMDYLHKDIEWE